VYANQVLKGGAEGAEWKHGFCDCCDLGAGECLFACCCPCIYAVTVSQEAGQDQWGFLTLASALFLNTYLPFFVVRSSVRDQFNIGGSTLEDVCVSCCCRKYFNIYYILAKIK
jgi:Cys-rich protein (TIGR01571 family)